MLIVTTNGIPGYRIEAVLGQVMGMTVRKADLGSNIAAGFRSLGGGELPELTKVVYESRNEVMSRMWSECLRRGGNAVVGMQFDTAELGKSFTEICAYGTAVVVTPIPDGEPGATPQSIARSAAENPGPGNWPQMAGQGAPAAPDFGDGHRPGAGAREQAPPAEESPRQEPARDEAPAPTNELAGVDDLPTAETQTRRPDRPASDRPAPAGPGETRPGETARPERPEDQRPNAGDSWLDLH